MRRWMIQPAGPAARASSVAGRGCARSIMARDDRFFASPAQPVVLSLTPESRSSRKPTRILVQCRPFTVLLRFCYCFGVDMTYRVALSQSTVQRSRRRPPDIEIHGGLIQ
jgi:hypothetical protein